MLAVDGAQVGEADVPQGGQLGAGAHGAGHPAGPVGSGGLVGGEAGEAGRLPGQLLGPVADAVVVEHGAEAAEAVGLDHVDA